MKLKRGKYVVLVRLSENGVTGKISHGLRVTAKILPNEVVDAYGITRRMPNTNAKISIDLQEDRASIFADIADAHKAIKLFKLTKRTTYSFVNRPRFTHKFQIVNILKPSSKDLVYIVQAFCNPFLISKELTVISTGDIFSGKLGDLNIGTSDFYVGGEVGVPRNSLSRTASQATILGRLDEITAHRVRIST